MPRPFDIQYATVALSGQVADFSLKRGFGYGLLLPILDTCSIAVRVSADGSSASYVPLQTYAGSGDYLIGVGAGSKAVTLVDAYGLMVFPYCRIYLSAPQTAVRTLQIISKYQAMQP